MIKGMHDKIHGVAFRNHRYKEGEYAVYFFDSERQRDSSLSQMGSLGEVLMFDFNLRQVVKRETKAEV